MGGAAVAARPPPLKPKPLLGVGGRELLGGQVALLVLVELVELGRDGRNARSFFLGQLAVVIGVGLREGGICRSGRRRLGRCIGRRLARVGGLCRSSEGEAGDHGADEDASERKRHGFLLCGLRGTPFQPQAAIGASSLSWHYPAYSHP